MSIGIGMYAVGVYAAGIIAAWTCIALQNDNARADMRISIWYSLLSWAVPVILTVCAVLILLLILGMGLYSSIQYPSLKPLWKLFKRKEKSQNKNT